MNYYYYRTIIIDDMLDMLLYTAYNVPDVQL